MPVFGRTTETVRNISYKDGEFYYEMVDYASRKAKLDVSGQQMHLIFFTQAGKELRKLIDMQSIESYTKALKNKLGDNFIIID